MLFPKIRRSIDARSASVGYVGRHSGKSSFRTPPANLSTDQRRYRSLILRNQPANVRPIHSAVFASLQIRATHHQQTAGSRGYSSCFFRSANRLQSQSKSSSLSVGSVFKPTQCPHPHLPRWTSRICPHRHSSFLRGVFILWRTRLLQPPKDPEQAIMSGLSQLNLSHRPKRPKPRYPERQGGPCRTFRGV